MKWIGQNIYDQVSRFRNNVHVTGDLTLTGDITMTGDVGLTGGLTASGTISADIFKGVADDDLQIWSDGSMAFTIDRDNDETSQLFAFYNYLTEIASIDESGNLQVDGTITTGTTAAMTSAGLLSVANQSNITGLGTITSGTWQATDIGVAHGGTGVSTLTTNAILTGNGASAIQAEAGLLYDSETLTVGDDDNGTATIKRTRHTDEAGGTLAVRGGDATGTDKAGGNLNLYAGRSTSNASGGSVNIYSNAASGGSGTTLQTSVAVATFRSDRNTLLHGSLMFEGDTPDAHEIFLTPADPGADATITVPAVTGTMAVSGASGSNMIVLGSGTGFVASPAAQKWYFGNSLYGFNHFNWASVNVSMVSDDATFTLSEDYNGVGMIVPAALAKVQLQVSCRPAGTSDETMKVVIASATRDAAGTNTTWTALASAETESVIGVWDPIDASYTGSVAASKILAIGIGINEGSVSTTNIRFNWVLSGYLA